MTEQLSDHIDPASGIRQIAAEGVPQGWGETTRSSPARREHAASSSLTASGRIGAPTGSRNRLTNTKSDSCASATASRSKV